MNTKSSNPHDLINQMVALRRQRAKLDQQINALKPSFFQACEDLKVSQLKHKHALITRRLTPGQWDYPKHVREQEQTLKQLKRQFQKTHEPTSGREINWVIKLID